MSALRKLHLRKNKVEKIEEEGLPEFPALTYLNLRGNKVPNLEHTIRLFTLYPALLDLNVKENPVE